MHDDQSLINLATHDQLLASFALSANAPLDLADRLCAKRQSVEDSDLAHHWTTDAAHRRIEQQIYQVRGDAFGVGRPVTLPNGLEASAALDGIYANSCAGHPANLVR